YQRYRPDAKGKAPAIKEADIVDAAQGVQGWLDVTIMRNTSLVEISASAPSSRLAAAIPNAVADAYIDWNVESRFKLIRQSRQFLATQIERDTSQIHGS